MTTLTTLSTAPAPVTAFMPHGSYGHAVVERLAGPRDPVLPVDEALVSADLPYADRLVMVVGQGHEQLRDALDALSFARLVPSVGLELSPTRLRCGPLVVPSRTACYACSMRRRRQHGDPPPPAEAGPLPEGYAEHDVLVGAGLVRLALEVLDAPAGAGHQEAGDTGDIGGQVWTMDLVTGDTSLARTVATDRCPTCSGRYAARRDALADLSLLLPERQGVV